MTFIAKIVEVLAWPIVIAFILWHSRSRLAGLLERLENFEGWGAKAAFSKQLDKVEENFPSLPLPPPNPSPPLLPPPENDLPPAYLIQQAWSGVRDALKEAVIKADVIPINPLTGSYLYNKSIIRADIVLINPLSIWGKRYSPEPRVLANWLRLSPDQMSSLQELSELRNKAVHGDRHGNDLVDITDALRYRDLAERVIQGIKEQADKLAQRQPSLPLSPSTNATKIGGYADLLEP